jgi:serine/threonine-protein kinase
MTPEEPQPLGSKRVAVTPEASPGGALFLPRGRPAPRARPRSEWTLPPYLQQQVPRRLRNTALLYSVAYFLSDLAPDIFTGQLVQTFRNPSDWVPLVASILTGLAVAGLASSPRLTWRSKLHLGLVFEVLGSYGIALSMYVGAERFASTPIVFFTLSPSWVAIWMIVYSIVNPAPPGRALLAMLASASAPAVLIATSLQRAGLSHVFTPGTFFQAHIFPYLICVVLAYSSARIMVTLGADVSRARELGSYRLIERLGQGGMGEVWRASHQLLARESAIKFIRPESILGMSAEESRTMIRRFELEAKATASLSSAHTVELYDFGVSDDGTFYYIMELLDGLDLDQLVRRFGPLPPSRVVHLMTQVCESLEEAHEKGLIHRDVKPANIYVCRSGVRRDFIKVLDFGLVAHRQAPAPSELRLTLPDHAIGTPAFMAPEAALGQELDGRSDLYGLGCVAYWLLTGRDVFEGSSVLEVISKHVNVAPDPPSRHCPGEIPKDLDALILRCLEKTPDRRPPSAAEVGRRLRLIPLADSWSEERAEVWWSEHVPVGSAVREPGSDAWSRLPGASSVLQ